LLIGFYCLKHRDTFSIPSLLNARWIIPFLGQLPFPDWRMHIQIPTIKSPSLLLFLYQTNKRLNLSHKRVTKHNHKHFYTLQLPISN
jgi:hypothetical protein